MSPRASHHWFEPVAEHLGDAYLRYSFTKGTENEVAFLCDELGLGVGSRLLDVGCGPGRHVRALRERGVEAVGIDISAAFVRLAIENGLPVAQADARALPVANGSFDAAISLCQGGFGLPSAQGDQPSTDDRQILAAMAAAVRSGGLVALSAFSAYFQLRFLEEDRDTFNAATGVNHERTEVRSPSGAVATVDLWTACYTPRELRMLFELVGLEVVGLWSVTPGGYTRHEPTVGEAEFLVVGRKP